jgi:hypothetical protein
MRKLPQLLFTHLISICGKIAIALYPQYINGCVNMDRAPLDERPPKVGRVS